MNQTLLLRMAFLTAALVVSACSSNPPEPEAEPGIEKPAQNSPKIRDLTLSIRSAPHDGSIPPHASPVTFVPWDSEAFLAVGGPEDPAPGALIVRYGKSGSVEERGPATVYVLEAAGPVIEPIALEWQPASGSELRAVARVNGELRHYDFDR